MAIQQTGGQSPRQAGLWTWPQDVAPPVAIRKSTIAFILLEIIRSSNHSHNYGIIIIFGKLDSFWFSIYIYNIKYNNITIYILIQQKWFNCSKWFGKSNFATHLDIALCPRPSGAALYRSLEGVVEGVAFLAERWTLESVVKMLKRLSST